MLLQSKDKSFKSFDIGKGEELLESSSGGLFDRGKTVGCSKV